MNYLIDNKGDKLFTTIYPAAGKQTVLLLHGGPGFPYELTEVEDMLKNNYQLISFHQRGTGQSPCASKDYSMGAYVSDIEAITAFLGIPQFHLFGHSWGGLYAQIYAEKFPEKLLSLFLCNPGSGTNYEWKMTEKEVLRFNRSKCTAGEWLLMGLNSLLSLMGNDNASKRVYKQVMKNYNAGYAGAQQAVFDFANVRAAPANKTRAEIAKYPLLKLVPSPAFPVTIVYGDKDIYGDSKEFVLKRFPTAQLYNISHCCHLPWLHNPAAFRQALESHYLTGIRR